MTDIPTEEKNVNSTEIDKKAGREALLKYIGENANPTFNLNENSAVLKAVKKMKERKALKITPIADSGQTTPVVSEKPLKPDPALIASIISLEKNPEEPAKAANQTPVEPRNIEAPPPLKKQSVKKEKNPVVSALHEQKPQPRIVKDKPYKRPPFFEHIAGVMMIGLLFFMLAIFFYLGFCVFTLTFKFDHPVLRRINMILPVPAIAGEEGFIDYYSYVDYIRSFPSSMSEFDVDSKAIDSFILQKVYREYGISGGSSSEVEMRTRLNNAILSDMTLNKDALERAQKLAYLVKNEDFMEIGYKLGDWVETQSLFPDEAVRLFGDGIKDLKTGEITGPLKTEKGIALIKADEVHGDYIDISVIYIKSVNLESVIRDRKSKTAFIKFF